MTSHVRHPGKKNIPRHHTGARLDRSSDFDACDAQQAGQFPDWPVHRF